MEPYKKFSCGKAKVASLWGRYYLQFFHPIDEDLNENTGDFIQVLFKCIPAEDILYSETI